MARYIYLIAGLVVVAVLIRLGMSGDVAGAAGEHSALKAFIIPFATVYLNTFNNPTTAITLCLAMAGAGVGFFLFYWLRRIGPAQADLRQVGEQLRGIDERGTRAALARVDQIMNRHELVSRGWKLYRATLIERSDGRISSRIPPVRYFDMRMLEATGVRLRFFLGLPNDFVGLGLIFTFMGLVAGLYFASQSMMSADLNVARAALVQLLHAATFKFLTSITGIAMSLLLSWAQNLLVERLRGELMEIQFILEEHFPMNTDADAVPVEIASGTAARATERSGALSVARPT